jgi:maleylpyruvate isomerase
VSLTVVTGPVDVPDATVEIRPLVAGIRRSQAAFEAALRGISDDQVRRPSLLPGWTRAHVLTHVARNADGATRMLEAAARGVVGEQYPGGIDQRNADIEAGVDRPAADMVADITASARRLDTAIDAMPEDGWGRPVRFAVAGVQPAWRCVFTRWREIEIHWSDLGLDRSPSAWPREFVDTYLGRELSRLGRRLPSGTAVQLHCPGYDGSYGDGSRTTTVTGPAYAIYAWLVGRPEQVRDVVTGKLPDLGAWT